jgi:outer membrane protein TolC
MKKTRTISINPSRLVVAKLPVSLLCPAVVALTSQPVLAAQSLPAPNQNLSIPSQNPAAPVQLPSMPGLSPSGVGPLAPTQAVPAPISTPQTLPLPSIFPPQSMTPFTVPPGFSLRQLPSEPPSASASAEALKTSPIKLGALIQVAALGPISLDAHFNQPITIEEALSYALEKSLPVRISRESSIYQTTQLAYYMSFFMPSFSTIYALAKSNVNSDTNTSAKIFQTRLSFPVFAGGSYTYFTLAQFYRVLGWNEAFHANVNDILLDVYNKYTNLVLNHHLLRIRIKAVEVSEAQLAQNTIMYQAGSGTKFAIMQARTQLATDRQALLSQQVATRQAALLLGYALDMPLSANETGTPRV